MQRRHTPKQISRVQVRADSNGKPTAITGYAAVFYKKNDPGTEYRIWDDYIERIMPGAFDRALAEDHDARALYNHNDENLLGRVSAGTVQLSVDKIGLRFEIPIDMEDPDHKRVVAKIQRGDLTGCSFAFNNASADWEELSVGDGDQKKTVFVRNLTDLDLFDVGPVTWPAYESTECGLRTAVETKDQLAEARSVLTAHRQSLISRHHADELDIETRWQQIV